MWWKESEKTCNLNEASSPSKRNIQVLMSHESSAGRASDNWKTNCAAIILSHVDVAFIQTHIISSAQKDENEHFASLHKQSLIRIWIRKCMFYALFRLQKKVNPMNSVIFVLFGKYCLIVDQLGSKDLSRDFQLNCVINYCFTYI